MKLTPKQNVIKAQEGYKFGVHYTDKDVDVKYRDLQQDAFLHNWLENRQTQMMNNLKTNNPKKAQAEINRQLENLRNTRHYNFNSVKDSYEFGTTMDKNPNIQRLRKQWFEKTGQRVSADYIRQDLSMKNAGYFSPVGNYTVTQLDSPDTITLHERTHALRAKPQEEEIKRNIKSRAKPLTGDKKWDEFIKKMESYFDTPTEIYSRLMQFRQANNLDPTKKYDIMELLEREEGVQDFNILNRYSKEDINYLLNEITANNDNIVRAQQGGVLKNRFLQYAKGGSITKSKLVKNAEKQNGNARDKRKKLVKDDKGVSTLKRPTTKKRQEGGTVEKHQLGGNLFSTYNSIGVPVVPDKPNITAVEPIKPTRNTLSTLNSKVVSAYKNKQQAQLDNQVEQANNETVVPNPILPTDNKPPRAVAPDNVNIPDSFGLKEFNKWYDEIEAENPGAAPYRKFLTQIAHQESAFNSSIQNQMGAPAYGYFQFLDSNIKPLGVSVEEFRNNPKLQINSAIKLAKQFESGFSKEDLAIAKQKGYTKFGLLGGAWLAGNGGVRKYLQGKGNPSDRHWDKSGKNRGTDVESRIKAFNFQDGGSIWEQNKWTPNPLPTTNPKSKSIIDEFEIPQRPFMEIAKEHENSKTYPRGGWNQTNQKWYPHNSVEGGSKTIAYGHKLKKSDNFSNGITDAQADSLYKEDVEAKYSELRNILKSKGQLENFDNLPPNLKSVATYYHYNGAGPNKFPSFYNALLKQDKEAMRNTYKRYFTQNGKKKEISGGNRMVKNFLNLD